MLPNFNKWDSAFPPGNGTPSINPSNAKSTVSSNWALYAGSSTSSSLAWFLTIISNSSFNKSSVISNDFFSASKPL